jgi:hypothetical protein
MKRHVRKKFERVEIEKLLLKGKFKKKHTWENQSPIWCYKTCLTHEDNKNRKYKYRILACKTWTRLIAKETKNCLLLEVDFLIIKEENIVVT